MKPKPRVFVVMPFGSKQVRAASAPAQGKAVQKALFVDYDEVFERLIAPALVAADCEPFRADRESAAGDIRTDMFFELVTADFVVADISILNANVFYELGVRHGVAPHGVAHLHGGWEKQPFDVAPDRLFKYDGTLWEKSVTRGAAWKKRLAGEVESLAATLRAVIVSDQTTTGSPVYSHLPGLQPVDWRQISIARARYFHGVLDNWKHRIHVARKQGWPGDILTLADDAPTRYHHQEILYAAATALIDLCRFDAAKGVLREMLVLAPDHLNAQCQLALTLNRLGEVAKAEALLEDVVARHSADPEAQGILGRVYKDQWRTRWEEKTALRDRQQAAGETSNLAATAVRSYATAQRLHLGSYYNGINVLSLAKLLAHLGRPIAMGDLEDLASVVRVAAKADLERALAGVDAPSQETAVWARATLGELALLGEDGATTLAWYQDTLASPGVTPFNVNSMLSQIELFQRLCFRPEAVGPVHQLLAAQAAMPTPRFRKVVVASGHMIDEPERRPPRFPQEKAGAVRAAIAAELERWGIGTGDLAICGGARGADLLFADLCLERGAHVRLLTALPEGDFLRKSVRLPRTDWEDRYFAVKERSEVWSQIDRLGTPPPGQSPFARNNLWMLNTARVEAPPGPIHAVLVWDEHPSGDGPGGTAHFAEQIDSLGARTAIVNPLRL